MKTSCILLEMKHEILTWGLSSYSITCDVSSFPLLIDPPWSLEPSMQRRSLACMFVLQLLPSTTSLKWCVLFTVSEESRQILDLKVHALGWQAASAFDDLGMTLNIAHVELLRSRLFFSVWSDLFLAPCLDCRRHFSVALMWRQHSRIAEATAYASSV